MSNRWLPFIKQKANFDVELKGKGSDTDNIYNAKLQQHKALPIREPKEDKFKSYDEIKQCNERVEKLAFPSSQTILSLNASLLFI